MSLEQWQDEYYPVSAENLAAMSARTVVGDLALVDHALRKWVGFLPSALKKHGVTFTVCTCVLVDDELGTTFDVGGSSCSLCKRYNQPDGLKPGTCLGCPLVIERGMPCFNAENGAKSPYTAFTQGGDPRPMIELLLAARLSVAKRAIERAGGDKTLAETEFVTVPAEVIGWVLSDRKSERKPPLIVLNHGLGPALVAPKLHYVVGLEANAYVKMEANVMATGWDDAVAAGNALDMAADLQRPGVGIKISSKRVVSVKLTGQPCAEDVLDLSRGLTRGEPHTGGAT